MTTQIRRLQEALENAGWIIAEIVDYNLDWWADEVWIIRQKQSEQTVLLTLVVDAIHDGARQEGRICRKNYSVSH